MLRILLLAPGSNPNGITGPLIGYSHGEALARLHAVTLVARSTYRNAMAVIAGSSQTYTELAAYREKLFFVPGENGVTLPFIRVLGAARRPATSLS